MTPSFRLVRAIAVGAEQVFMLRDADLASSHVASFIAIAGARPVYSVAVNSGVDGGGNRCAELLCKMSQ
jgi:hypothetical protein